jgi:hypothetical protein
MEEGHLCVEERMVATPVLAPSLPGWDDEDVVPEKLITSLYSAGEDNALSLSANLTPNQRALIAAYCYRRSHLHRLGLVIAGTCDQATLTRIMGASLGSMVFVQSRERDLGSAVVSGSRAKVTLARSPGLAPKVVAVNANQPDDGDTDAADVTDGSGGTLENGSAGI